MRDPGNLPPLTVSPTIVAMSLTSLLVCADANAVQVLSRILTDLGMAVEHCGDLHEASKLLSTQHFDSLLVDCKNERAALEVVSHARSSAGNKATVVIALMDAPQEVSDLFASGVNFVLYKSASKERTESSMRWAQTLMRPEKRASARTPVQSQASISYGNTENAPATLIDISEDGIAVRTDRKLPVLKRVYFQFALPQQSATIRLAGEVMWQDSDGRVGMRFVAVPRASRRVLNQWLAANPVTPDPDAPAFGEVQHPALSGENLSIGLGVIPVAHSSGNERRDQSRRECQIGADVYRSGSTVPYRCSLSDISPGGCYLTTTETFAMGTELEIVVRTEDSKFRLRGTVKSMHPSFGMGIQFNLKTAEQRLHVQQLVAYQASETAAEPETSIES
ncbi:MAG: PilZ domain-containing protein [Acidobacteriales bacterium]|nr:PilZ domain-containing protein [Terriglobales bacterium]